MIDDRHLTVELQEVFPFERAQEALEVVEAKHVRGKLVLTIA
jgi:NADPH:quinone reductase-like Zn-dependent oxidoreductase